MKRHLLDAGIAGCYIDRRRGSSRARIRSRPRRLDRHRAPGVGERAEDYCLTAFA